MEQIDKMKFEVYGASIIGGRDYQEDSWSISKADGSLVTSKAGDAFVQMSTPFLGLVADGIGGGGNGDVASQLVAEQLPQLFFNSDPDVEQLRDAIISSDIQLGNVKSKNKDFGSSMGTTLIVSYFEADSFTFGSVGDSRLFRFRDDEIHFINELHERGLEHDQQQLQTGEDLNEAQRVSGRAYITSALVGTGIQRIQTATRRLEAGDTYILASDGLELVEPELMRRVVFLYQNKTVGELANALLDLAQAKGEVFQNAGHDNATLLIVRCIGEPADNPASQPVANRIGVTVHHSGAVDDVTEPHKINRGNVGQNSRLNLQVVLAAVGAVLLGFLAYIGISMLDSQPDQKPVEEQTNIKKLNAPGETKDPPRDDDNPLEGYFD